MPVLGICYGQQAMVAQLGGTVEGGHAASSAAPTSRSGETSALFDGVWEVGERDTVWMSHGDRVTALPPGFKVVGDSKDAPFAAIADEKRRSTACSSTPRWRTRPTAPG